MAILDGVISPIITVTFDTAGLGPLPTTTSVWAPVPTSDVRAVSIRRGKTQENQSVQPGTMTLTLSNQSGDYDPEKLAAPWTLSVFGTDISLLSARMGVRVTATWNSVNYTLFQGYMESLSLDYGINPTATLTFVDGLSYLATQQLEPLLIPEGNNDTVRERVSRIANQQLIAGTPLWPASLRNLSNDVDTALYATTFAGDALSLMQTAAQCHPGARLFISNDGKLTLMEDDAGLNTGLILSDSQASGTVGYDLIEVDPGSKYLINSVTVNKVDGQGRDRGTVTDEDAASIARYGVAGATYTLPLPTAQPLATYLAYEYSEPVDRVRRITFSAMGLGAEFPKVLVSDLGEYCVVERTTMDARALSWNCQIEGIEHDITPNDWRMGFVTSIEATIPAPPPGPEPSNNGDPIPPSPPTGLTGTTAAYVDFREPRARVSLTWSAPTTNTDGSELIDLRWYEVQFKLSSASDWEFGGISYTATLVLSNLTVATGYDFRVFAVDSSNNKSAASNTFTITTANVTTFVGATPSTPTLASRLGTLQVIWDGLNNGGGVMPADFDFVEVHVSTTSGFTPTAGTYKGRLSGADLLVLADLAYATTYYVKLVAYNKSGVASNASAQASSTVSPVVDADIIANTISGAKIQNGTITASDKIIGNTITGALIQGLAITGDKIAGNAIDGKTITGAIIQTESTASRGIKLDSAGLKAYNTSGVETVSIASNGSASFTGSVTSTSGTIGGFTIGSTSLNGSGVQLSNSGSGSVTAGGTIAGGGLTTSGTTQTSTLSVTNTATVGGNLTADAQFFIPNRATSTSAANVRMNTITGQILEITSSARYKKDIAPAAIPDSSALALQPKTFRPIVEEDGVGLVLGLIAEEVAAIPVLGDLLVNYDDQGRPDSVNYDRIAIALIDVIKDLSARVEALEAGQ